VDDDDAETPVATIERVRRFNRRWTEVLGLLAHGLLATEHSLTEARVIFELGHGAAGERRELRERLGIDASFLTRVLTGLEERGLVTTSRSELDGRRLDVHLTAAGRESATVLDARSDAQIAELLAPLTGEERRTLSAAMTVVAHLLRRGDGDGERSIGVRQLRAGDLGWVVQRHGEVYAQEYGWDMDFEALVARIVADYWTGRRPRREAAWIAEVDGARAGCVFCVEKDASTAQLRILLVEPWARGLGIGARLVEECITYAEGAGYAGMVLWTNDVLISARRIYEAAGFRLVESEPHHSFGHDLIGQNWEVTF